MTSITAYDKSGSVREAYYLRGKIAGVDGKANGYRCFPASTNDASLSKSFETIEEAARFLRANPAWGIRMKPGSAIFTNILINGVKR